MKTVRACTFEGCDSEPPLYRNKYNENHVWCEGHMISHGIIKENGKYKGWNKIEEEK